MERLKLLASRFLIFGMVVASCRPVAADLQGSVVLSVEWLTHKSDSIVVVQNDNGDRSVLHVMKGSGKLDSSLSKLKMPVFGFGSVTAPPRLEPENETLSLLFLQQNVILQEVVLDRDNAETPRFYNRFYGVNEMGDIILSESALLRSITSALKQDRGNMLRRIPEVPVGLISGVSGPSWFPLEYAGHTYTIVTICDQAWRDRLIDLVRHGTAAQRIWAIWQLSYNDDKKSVDVLKQMAVVLPEGVVPSSNPNFHQTRAPLLNAMDVQRAAQERLRWLRSR